jgi:hypothetical protein
MSSNITSPRLSSTNEHSGSPNVWYSNPDLSMGEVIHRFDTKMKAAGYPKAAEVRNRKLALFA